MTDLIGKYEEKLFPKIQNSVGGIARKPGVGGDGIAIREFLQFSIYFDHEIIDCARAARFTSRFVELMENAFSLTVR